MGCTPSKEGSEAAPRPIETKKMDEAMMSKGKGAAAGMSGSSELASANIIFVLGGPGSGKGTQCDKILQRSASAGVLDVESLCPTLLQFVRG